MNFEFMGYSISMYGAIRNRHGKPLLKQAFLISMSPIVLNGEVQLYIVV